MIQPDGRVLVSGSTLKDAATCTLADVLRHGYARTTPDESGRRTCGSAVHVAIAAYLSALPAAGPQRAAATALAAFDAAYCAWSARHCLPEEWIGRDGQAMLTPNPRRWENVRVILAEWLDAHRTLDYEVLPETIEGDFRVELAPGVDYRVRTDAIVRQGGVLWVHDTKTTGRLDANFWRQWVMDATLTGYVWAAERRYGVRVAGVLIQGIQIAEVPRSTRMCKGHGMAYADCGHLHVKWEQRTFPRSPQDVVQWVCDAQAMAQRHAASMPSSASDRVPLADAPATGKFHNACRWCDFFRYCEAGRPIERLHEMTVTVEAH